VAREVISRLEERSEDGFVYNVDVRLRPEGETGPLVRSLSSMENYYPVAGQTWERLALIKARPVAGDRSLGEEFLESVHAFRYPRHPPPGLLTEVAGVKLRIEREVVGTTDLDRHIKSGHGGIREIEFYLQTLQILNAGNNPFLQSGSTLDALDQMARYEIIEEADGQFLRQAYLFLREVENRLQMREEQQTHLLPADGQERTSLALSLGFADTASFDEHLEATRAGVRRLYRSIFQETEREGEIQDWILFFSGKPPSAAIAAKLSGWFGDKEDPELSKKLRHFLLGGPHYLLTREQVDRFLDIASQFDTIVPRLAQPLRTLGRVSGFAERYGARKLFFQACVANPNFFQVLCLLFDRSSFTYDLLRQHPEIFEEVLGIPVGREKDLPTLLREISLLPSGKAFAKWLWLYTKAEQVRQAIGELLGVLSIEQVEENLTLVADAVITSGLRKVDPEGELTVVALGKYGGRELTFGSDLDIIILSPDGDIEGPISKAEKLRKLLAYRHPLGRTYELDLRLRPHGDGGPLATTLRSMAEYHEGSAQPWEKQILTRSRVAGGNEQLAQAFVGLRERILFSAPLEEEEKHQLLAMREKIEREKGLPESPYRAFKNGPGGLIDIEFIAQIKQLQNPGGEVDLRSPNTRRTLAALRDNGLLERSDADNLIDNYNFLRRLEYNLRRDDNTGITVLADEEMGRNSLAKWLQFDTFKSFWKECLDRMQATREIYNRQWQ